jgi:hypothetical protein
VSVPWRVSSAITLYVATIIGGALLVLSWYGASGSAQLGTAMAWLNVGVLGLVVAGTGNVVWLVYGQRAVRTRQRALLDGVSPLVMPAATIDLTDERVAVPGARRAHRPSCPLVAGKATVVVGAGDRLRCEACQP